MSYLVYNTKEEALERAEQQGILKNYWYHRLNAEGVKNKIGTRYQTYPQITSNNTWALDVTEYELTEDEQAATTNSVTFPTPEGP